MRLKILDFKFRNVDSSALETTTEILNMIAKDEELTLLLTLKSGDNVNVFASMTATIDELIENDPELRGRGFSLMLDTFVSYVRGSLLLLAPELNLKPNLFVNAKKWLFRYTEIIADVLEERNAKKSSSNAQNLI